MNRFRNILFVSHGIADETEALKQALSLAQNNKAALQIKIVCPTLPKEMGDYEGTYEAALRDQAQASLQAARNLINVPETALSVEIEVESGQAPAIRVIRQVLKHAYDLVIKEAQAPEGGRGFRAMDMELLRKCPVPVWLTRPIQQHRHAIRVAVAIDPQNETPEGHDLSLNLLTLARSLADTCSGELRVVSCWDCPYEKSLYDNVWIKISTKEINRILESTQENHRKDLNRLIYEASLSGHLIIDHLQGIPETIIPNYVAEQKIDILVMGTVARTGIYSFVLGNTAENILRNLSCSLLALKPNGFISPVPLY